MGILDTAQHGTAQHTEKHGTECTVRQNPASPLPPPPASAAHSSQGTHPSQGLSGRSSSRRSGPRSPAAHRPAAPAGAGGGGVEREQMMCVCARARACSCINSCVCAYVCVCVSGGGIHGVLLIPYCIHHRRGGCACMSACMCAHNSKHTCSSMLAALFCSCITMSRARPLRLYCAAVTMNSTCVGQGSLLFHRCCQRVQWGLLRGVGACSGARLCKACMAASCIKIPVALPSCPPLCPEWVPPLLRKRRCARSRAAQLCTAHISH